MLWHPAWAAAALRARTRLMQWPASPLRVGSTMCKGSDEWQEGGVVMSGSLPGPHADGLPH